MQIHVTVSHPIPLNQKIRANRPSCPCAGATNVPVEGTVSKVIENQGGYWYYLGDVGVTVKGEWVESLVAR